MGWDISLSASKLGLLNECARCFYLANSPAKVERPRGPFPSLPSGLDRVIKDHWDLTRPALPPELIGKLPADMTLWGTREQIAKQRHWKSAMKCEIDTLHGRVSLIGAFDDLLVDADGALSPLDAKSKGNVPKTDGAEFYQRQLDVYALQLLNNGQRISGRAFLAYYYPVTLTSGETLPWGCQVFELEADPARANELIGKATALLAGPLPESSEGCEWCAYVRNIARSPLLVS